MHLIIDPKPLPNPKLPDSYEVVIQTMLGDGDAFSELTLGPFPAVTGTKALQSLLETVKALIESGPHSEENYPSLPYFLAWFSNEVHDPTELFYRMDDIDPEEHARVVHLYNTFQMEWLYDQREEGYYAYRSHEVFYYDEDLDKHKVSVRL